MKQDKPTILEAPLALPMPFEEALERFSRINTRLTETEAEPPTKGAYPFIKWAGGKRSIIGELVSHLPATFGDYYEPFAGGAALFFEIHGRLTRSFLSDSNLDLMITYAMVKKQPDALIAKLEEYASKDSNEYYYKVRAQYNLQDPLEIAARFIYLNKTCYNGLYRVNRKGEFNVPRGSYEHPDIAQAANIKACSLALQRTEVSFREFDTIAPHEGDFVYCDPPYHPVGNASFTKYTKLDFSEKDQERLRDFAAQLANAGVNVMLSNSDAPFIRTLYQGATWHIATVQAPRNVNCKGEGRGLVNELLITNYPMP